MTAHLVVGPRFAFAALVAIGLVACGDDSSAIERDTGPADDGAARDDASEPDAARDAGAPSMDASSDAGDPASYPTSTPPATLDAC